MVVLAKLYIDLIAIIPIVEYNILIMEYLTATELSKVWNISIRRIGVLCTEGRVDGAIKKGKMWLIPDTSQKPADARYKKNKHNA
jgi:hypothetical protein